MNRNDVAHLCGLWKGMVTLHAKVSHVSERDTMPTYDYGVRKFQIVASCRLAFT